MMALALFVLALFAGSAYSSPARIVGGNTTDIQSYPFIVQVEFLSTLSGTWTQHCAGIILTTRNILSVAHCFDGQYYSANLRRVRAGASSRGNGGVISNVEVAYNHPSFGANDYDGDISVVRLVTPLVYGTGIQQGQIPTQNFVIPDGLAVAIVGWGQTTEFGEPSELLQQGSILTINNQVCRLNYENAPNPGVVTNNMICAGLANGGRDSCQGDSGAPLIFDSFVVGLASWGYGCGNGVYPGVNTRVSSYTTWIADTAV